MTSSLSNQSTNNSTALGTCSLDNVDDEVVPDTMLGTSSDAVEEVGEMGTSCILSARLSLLFQNRPSVLPRQAASPLSMQHWVV